MRDPQWSLHVLDELINLWDRSQRSKSVQVTEMKGGEKEHSSRTWGSCVQGEILTQLPSLFAVQQQDTGRL